MGTPAPAWHIEAKVPPDPVVGVREIVIDATYEPKVGTTDGVNYLNLEPVTPTTWPGRGRYLVPEGMHLYTVMINERCKGRGCSCDPPSDAKILSIEGACADAACKPPAGAKVEITKVVGERAAY